MTTETLASGRMILYSVRASVPVQITPEPLRPLTRWGKVILYLTALYR